MNHLRLRHIPEVAIAGKRLGRHIEHDPRSTRFAVQTHTFDLKPRPIHSAKWIRYCAPFNQGETGACTGNAAIGSCMTGPNYVPGRELTEADAVDCYSLATHLDKIPGFYPPTDTGSSGVAAAKAAKKRGFVDYYHHCFSLASALVALSAGPVIAGVNWYEGFDAPTGTNSLLTIAGDVRGGHEVELLEIDVDLALVRGVNSWGEDWGDHGYFVWTFDTLDRLLHEHGDVTQLIGKGNWT